MVRGNKKGKGRRLGKIERDILEELTFGDTLYAILLSSRSTKQMFKLARERATYRYRRKLAIERLKEQSFILASDERLSLTNRGRNVLGATVRDTRALLKQKAWDGQWRIVAFDIPEKYTDIRNRVREILKMAGFIQLQQSIWIFPHECEELTQLIRQESRLSKHILYGVLEHLSDEERLRKKFKL